MRTKALIALLCAAFVGAAVAAPICRAQGQVFFDGFEYAADRNVAGLRAIFTAHGWGGFKDMTTSNPGAGGYVYHLFLGTEPALPCEGRAASSPGAGELALLDVNGDGRIDVSDPVSALGFLFVGGTPPTLGTECVRIPGCPPRCP